MPVQVACAGCQKAFRLKDEWAGRKVKCPSCGSAIDVPKLPPVMRAPPPAPIVEPIDQSEERDEVVERQEPVWPARQVKTPRAAPVEKGGGDFNFGSASGSNVDRDEREEEDLYFDSAYEEEQEDNGLPRQFRHDKYLLRQKMWTVFSEKYNVSDPHGNPIIYIERPAMFRAGCLAVFVLIAGLLLSGAAFMVGAFIGDAIGLGKDVRTIISCLFFGVVVFFAICLFYKLVPRRHITFFADDRKRKMLMRAFQDQKFVFLNAWYTLADSDGNILCRFRKNHIYNILRKRWYIYDADYKLLLVAKEDSLIISLLRRVFGMFDDWLSWIFGGLLRTNFIFLTPGDNRVIGEFNRKFTIVDRYVLDLTRDKNREIDRRVGVALGVLLDTGERR